MIQTREPLIRDEKHTKLHKTFTKLEDSINDIYRTDDTVGLLRYVSSMLMQDEIQLKNEISDDVNFFLSKAIENLTYNFESNRLLLEEFHRMVFDMVPTPENETKD